MPDLKGTNEVSNLNEPMRADFEALPMLDDYRPLRRNTEEGNYTSVVVEVCWQVFQAARRQHGSAAQGCEVNDFSSRMCERGTKSCTVVHAAPPVTDAEGASSWCFARVRPTGTILAIEPSGKRHVVKHGDMDSVAGRDLLEAMSDALSRRPAAVTEATELQQELEDFDIERTGDGRYDASNFLLNAAQEFWQACHNAGQYGGVQWLTGTGGELLIYTRGEYRDQLMRNIAVLDYQKEHKFPPVAAEQPAAAGNALTFDLIIELADQHFDLKDKARRDEIAGRIRKLTDIVKFARAIEQHLRAAPQAAPEWVPVSRAGQVKVGDKLRFTIGDKQFNQRAKQILHAGTDKEEVIYDKGRNFYFITSSVLSGWSNHKNVEVLAAHTRASDGQPDDIRAAGWAVAVHNDYRLNGQAHTFWLFTKDGRAIKGEGKTDADALAEVRAAMQQAASNQQEGAK